MKNQSKIALSAIIFLVASAASFFIWDRFFCQPSALIQPLTQIKAEISDDELKEKIGQMLFVGFRGIKAPQDSEIYKIIKNVKPGGIMLFDYDVPSASFERNIENPEQVKSLIKELQNDSKTPLFMAVDAEGGNVLRLKKEYGFVGILSPEKMAETKSTAKESAKLAKELHNLGFNMDFAPVIDVNVNPKNPIIGKLERSFSSNPEIVAENARIFIENLAKENIVAVAKHFPGHGSSSSDSHLGIVDVTKTYQQNELLPYKSLNQQGILRAVMTAHIINKNIDEKYPATLSDKFLENILRKEIGFSGIIISDDMQMSAISKNYGFEESIVLAVNAGVDMISISNNTTAGYDKNAAYKARDAIFSAVKQGKISQERINESYKKILDLKLSTGLDF